jgi:hypothetical protein
MDLEDDDHVAITLDAMNTWSPSEQFFQIKMWSDSGIKNSKKLEKVIQDSSYYLKCKIEDLVSTMKKAIDEGGKEDCCPGEARCI